MEIENDKIIIDLHETDTKRYDDINFIQKDAKKTFIDLVKKFNISTKNDDDNICHVHNTILINGKRGMGKSSFALHMEKHKFGNLKLCPLKIIDPTTVETREHIFLLIITLIKNQVEEYIKCEKFGSTEDQYKAWKKRLKELAGGLSMLDGVGKSHLEDSLWDSPELILEKGLSNTKHGYKLEENFHKFIEESLTALKQDAFLITLDDIDTSLDKGKVILEVLRKYITTPKIITVLLGDIELYSTLVRQMQWKKIDPEKILQEYEFDKNKDQYISQIEHLEEQYLVKILKPENRIHLKTIYQLIDKIHIAPKHPKDEEMEATSTLAQYSTLMMETLFLSKRYSHLFEQTLYNQPIRSVVQLFKAYWEHGHKLTPEYVTKFHDIFYTTLYKQLAKYQLLEIESFSLMNLLGKYVITNPNIDRDSNLELLPEYSDSDANVAAIYINLLFNERIKPNEYLSYFIKVGYALEQYNVAVSEEKNSKSFMTHIGLDSNEPNSRIARRLLTTFKIDNNKFRDSYFEFGNISFSLAKQATLKKNPYIPLILSNVYNPVGGKLGFLSFWNLLGILADITQAKDEKEAQEILKNNTMIRDYYLYAKSVAFIKDDTNGSKQEHTNETDNDTLFTELAQWAVKVKSIEQLPMYVLGKIWIRTVYSLHEIDNRSNNKQKNYLEMFQFYISAFLNAVYVQIEIYLGSNHSQTLFNLNPSENLDFFKNKLVALKKYFILESGQYIEMSALTPWHTELFIKEGGEYRSIKENPKNLFEHLYICPIVSNFNSYFAELSTLKFKPDEDKQNTDTDFGKLPIHVRQDEMRKAFDALIDETLKANIKNYNLLDSQEQQNTTDHFRKQIYALGYKKGFNKWMMNDFKVEK
ncbi:MAG: hypothetical protein RBR12_02130 [Sulfurospirillum cavolei]|nr:hypothetical protein [Sulfurospirillum cavolei]